MGRKKKTAPVIAESENRLDILVPDVVISEQTENIKVSTAPNKLIKVQAKQFVKSLEAGAEPEDAAREMGLSLHIIKNRPEMEVAIQKLMDKAHFSAEIKKAVVKAGLFKTFMQGQQEGADLIEVKLGLEAAKLMMQDPELGMQEAPPVAVEVNLGPLQEVADKLERENESRRNDPELKTTG